MPYGLDFNAVPDVAVPGAPSPRASPTVSAKPCATATPSPPPSKSKYVTLLSRRHPLGWNFIPGTSQGRKSRRAKAPRIL